MHRRRQPLENTGHSYTQEYVMNRLNIIDKFTLMHIQRSLVLVYWLKLHEPYEFLILFCDFMVYVVHFY